MSRRITSGVSTAWRGRSHTVDPRILDLQPEFLLAREIAPLGIVSGRLALGMRDIADIEAIAAVRFATGLEIDPVAIDTREWSEWQQALVASIGPASGSPSGIDRRFASLALDACDVHVRIPPDYADSFAASDRDGWSRLKARLGRSPAIAVVLLAGAARTIDLPHVPQGEADLRRELQRRSPLSLDRLAWSATASCDAHPVAGLSIVRKAWLDGRIATIARALSPDVLTVSDEVGRRFELPYRTSGSVPLPAAAAGTISAACVAALVVGLSGTPPKSVLPAGVASPPIATARELYRPTPTPALTPTPAAGVGEQADPFELVGVVGRLPNDAVALVRPAWGRTVTLRVGDSLLGWRLGTIAADRVTLTKGAATRAIVVKPLPAG